jgi:hypothetical protein
MLNAEVSININNINCNVYNCDAMSVSDDDLITGVFIPLSISDKATSGMSTLLDITMQATSSSVPPGISHQATNSSTLSTDVCQVFITQTVGKFSAACFQVDCLSAQLTGKNIYTKPISGHTSPCTSEDAISCSTLPGVNNQATRSSMLAVNHKHDYNQLFEEYCQILDNGPNLLQAIDNKSNHIQVVDNEPNYLQVVDNESKYLQIVDDEANYLQIVDDDSKYLQIVDDESKYLQVINNKSAFDQIVENELGHLETIEVESVYHKIVDSENQQITTGIDESLYHQIADDAPNYQQIESSDHHYEEITINEQINSSQATYNTPANMSMDYYELHVNEDKNCDFRNLIHINKLVNINFSV